MSNKKKLEANELYVKPEMEVIDMPKDYILTVSPDCNVTCPTDGSDDNEPGMTGGDGDF